MDFIRKILQASTGQYASLFLEMVTSVLIARVLGPTNYGIYTIAYILPNLIVSAGSFGFGPALVYHMNKEKSAISRLFFTFTLIGLGLGFLYVLIFYSIIDWVQAIYLKEKVSNHLLLVAMFLVPLLITEKYIRALLRGLYRIGQFTIVTQFFPAVLRLILVVIALYWLKLGLTGIVAIPVIINLAVLFALVFVLRKEIFSGIEVRNLFVSWRELKGILSFGGQSHIGALIQKSNNEIAAPIMTAFIEPAAIGFYKLAWYLVGSVSRIEGVIDLVLMTKIARSKTEDLRKFFPQLHRFLFSLLMVLMLLSALIMPWFVRLVYGEAYTPVVPLFWILMPGVPLVTMITTTNTLFTQSGKPLMKSVIRIFGLLLNVALLLILMPKLHAVGAAIATSAGYILMFIISTSIVKSQLGVSTRDLLVLRRSDLSYLATNIKALYRRLPIHSLRAARLKQS